MLKDAISFDQVLNVAPEIIPILQPSLDITPPTPESSNVFLYIIIAAVIITIILFIIKLYFEGQHTETETKPLLKQQ